MKLSMGVTERLRSASPAELEDMYASAPLAPLPGGRWRGTYLRELPMRAGERVNRNGPRGAWFYFLLERC